MYFSSTIANLTEGEYKIHATLQRRLYDLVDPRVLKFKTFSFFSIGFQLVELGLQI